jgi:translation initiation factor eIF-2B subunit epsilon
MTSKQSAERLIEEEEEVLQAVILADSFNKRFRPLTTRKPRVMIGFSKSPIATKPNS